MGSAASSSKRRPISSSAVRPCLAERAAHRGDAAELGVEHQNARARQVLSNAAVAKLARLKEQLRLLSLGDVLQRPHDPDHACRPVRAAAGRARSASAARRRLAGGDTRSRREGHRRPRPGPAPGVRRRSSGWIGSTMAASVGAKSPASVPYSACIPSDQVTRVRDHVPVPAPQPSDRLGLLEPRLRVLELTVLTLQLRFELQALGDVAGRRVEPPLLGDADGVPLEPAPRALGSAIAIAKRDGDPARGQACHLLVAQTRVVGMHEVRVGLPDHLLRPPAQNRHGGGVDPFEHTVESRLDQQVARDVEGARVSLQALLCTLSLGDVLAGAQIAGDLAVAATERDRVPRYPGHRSIGPLEAVLLAAERRSGRRGVPPARGHAVVILRMDGPAPSRRPPACRASEAGQRAPALVDEQAPALGVALVDPYRRGSDERAKAMI